MTTARDVYEVVLEPHRRRHWLLVGFFAILALVFAAFGGGVSGWSPASKGHWVVRRRHDGIEVARLLAPGDGRGDAVKRRLDSGLREMAPAAFVRACRHLW